MLPTRLLTQSIKLHFCLTYSRMRMSLRTWPYVPPTATQMRIEKDKEKIATADLVSYCSGATLAHMMLKMWLYLLYIAVPIAAAINLLSKRIHKPEWVEFSQMDAQPSAQREPMPEYDDPFLRADHPFWEGDPPTRVIAGEYQWEPPRLQDIPPVNRFPRRPLPEDDYRALDDDQER